MGAEPLLITTIGLSLTGFLVGVRLRHWLQQSKADQFNLVKPAWFQTGLQIGFYLGLPYFMLVMGYLPARFLGLKGIAFLIWPNFSQPASAVIDFVLTQIGKFILTWMADIGPAAAAGAGLGGMMLLLYWLYLQALKPNPELELRVYHSKIGLIFEVMHWAFYRAIIWYLVDSIYLGTMISLAVLAVEYSLAGRLGNFSAGDQRQYLLRFSLGLTTSILFLFAPNLWLIFLFHFLMVIMVEELSRIALNLKAV